ncbi:hypothetical protein GCM10009555_063020 [Acrocarpospora macrocephala]|uniref:Uncharacterized protein n=1 Tax=Acrocarpospora macrocephala TaxID=150177 RepID=A0A5M3WLJ1_9ACTN|nr:hypothetical protein Amac_013580 [Acrocarpospora macrocephala]
MPDLVKDEAGRHVRAGADGDDPARAYPRHDIPERDSRRDGLAAQMAEIIKIGDRARPQPDRVEFLRQPGGDMDGKTGQIVHHVDELSRR